MLPAWIDPFPDPRLGGQGVNVPSSVFFHPLPDGLYGRGRCQMWFTLPQPGLCWGWFGQTLANVLRPSVLIWGTGVTPTVISYRERCSNERFERSRRERENETPFKEGSSVALVGEWRVMLFY